MGVPNVNAGDGHRGSERRPALRRALCRSRVLVPAFLAAVVWSGPAHAHRFAERYDLPVPLGLYLAGAAAAVSLTFVALALFQRRLPGLEGYPRFDLLKFKLGRALAHPAAVAVYRLLAVAAFALVLAAGFFGSQEPKRNILPTVVWVLWWVGLAYVAALAGDLWALVNPWKAVFLGARALVRKLARGREPSFGLRWPEALGAWPAVLFLLAFAWMELVWPEGQEPRSVACAALAYSAIAWAGMLVFGMERWLRAGEAFSVMFALLARFAPTEAAEGSFRLRPYAVGLVADRPAHASLLAFVLVMLATVTYDGIKETDALKRIVDAAFYLPGARTVLPALARVTGDVRAALDTLLFLGFVAIFAAAYVLFANGVAIVMVRAARPAAGDVARAGGAIAGLFAFSLLPIAIAYHLAHYLSYLLINGQLIVPLISDPFGFGWDLFGTARFKPDIGVVGARFAWYASVIAIVVGHMCAVYVAHATAWRAFRDKRLVLASQAPLAALMVGYTTLSLWILAQPIVE